MTPEIRAQVDGEHLRLLALGHYVTAGLAFLTIVFPLTYVGMGLLVWGHWPGLALTVPSGVPPRLLGGAFVITGLVNAGVVLAMAACNVFAGRCIAQRRRRVFCLVVGVLNCLFAPTGTLLGVFTLVVLRRDSVREKFLAQA